MPSLKLEWLPHSKAQFETLRDRAARSGKLDAFSRNHNHIATALREVEKAGEKGEKLYDTKKDGGEIRHWVHEHISV